MHVHVHVHVHVQECLYTGNALVAKKPECMNCHGMDLLQKSYIYIQSNFRTPIHYDLTTLYPVKLHVIDSAY